MFHKMYGSPQIAVPYGVFDDLEDAKSLAQDFTDNYMNNHNSDVVKLDWDESNYPLSVTSEIEAPYDEHTQKPHPERKTNVFYFWIVQQPYKET